AVGDPRHHVDRVGESGHVHRVGLAARPLVHRVEVVRVIWSGAELIGRQPLDPAPRRMVGQVVLLAGGDELRELGRIRKQHDLGAVAEEALPLLSVLVLPRRRVQGEPDPPVHGEGDRDDRRVERTGHTRNLTCCRWPRPHRAGQTPTGCQTVLVSTNAASRAVLGSGCQSSSAGAKTRLTLSAAARCSAGRSAGSTPVRSIAFTSRWLASHGASSAGKPVSRLTTPPGRSDVARTSVSDTAGSGRSREATMTVVLPVVMIGAITDTRPRRLDSCGARAPTTPVGSGSEKLKYGPATELALPVTWAYLSATPRTTPIGRSPAPPSRQRPRHCHLRRPAPPRRTALAGHPAVPRCGRAPGPGCRPSRRPSLGTLCGRRLLRPVRPCARPAPRGRATRRPGWPPGRTVPTPTAGRPRRCTACTSCARGAGRQRSG